ncbi:hypothetical protein ACFLU6_04300 [Acidobacteriota bacterium]
MSGKRPSQPITEDPSDRPETPAFSTEGVDLTLIRWMLSMTPAERLETLQHNVWSILRIRGEESQT